MTRINKQSEQIHLWLLACETFHRMKNVSSVIWIQPVVLSTSKCCYMKRSKNAKEKKKCLSMITLVKKVLIHMCALSLCLSLSISLLA